MATDNQQAERFYLSQKHSHTRGECWRTSEWDFSIVQLEGKQLNVIIFRTKWWQWKKQMANIVLSYSKIKFEYDICP